jgi:hypothetical protein
MYVISSYDIMMVIIKCVREGQRREERDCAVCWSPGRFLPCMKYVGDR